MSHPIRLPHPDRDSLVVSPPPPISHMHISPTPTPVAPELHRATAISYRLTYRLYTSHFLSTWNSRLFEFAAVLFLADIFPDTLLPMSVYALTRSGAAILLAQTVGSYIDKGNRLAVVRASIVAQRVAVAGSCGLFWLMRGGHGGRERAGQGGVFGGLVMLACVEKLGAVANLVAVERDWVCTLGSWGWDRGTDGE